MIKTVKYILLFLVLLLLALPAIQQGSRLVEERDLIGFFSLRKIPEMDSLTCENWFSDDFQKSLTSGLEDHVGFRKSFIRIFHEYDYSLYGLSHAQGFIRGKKGFLFEEDYIHEYLGTYFIGKTTWDYKLNKFNAVREALKNHGTDLILVLEPGKASFHPCFIPDRFHPEQRTLSNYDYITAWMQSRDIPYLDLDQYFQDLKDISRYPLFPKYGMHWSIYGAALVMDTLSKYIEVASNSVIPDFTITEIDISDSLRWTDKDIGDMLNLLFPLPRVSMAYPDIRFDTTDEEGKLSVLVVADSYYINLINYRLYTKPVRPGGVLVLQFKALSPHHS